MLIKTQTSDEVAKDKNIKVKYDKVVNFLKTTNQQKLDESFILKIAQIQELVKEIQAND